MIPPRYPARSSNIPPVPYSTPSSHSYSQSRPKPGKAPIYNPYDKFTQPEFDDWIGGITDTLRKALGYADEVDHSGPEHDDNTRGDEQEGSEDGQGYGEESDDAVDDSFAEIKARRANGKGKSRDPREGPGLAAGSYNEPIDILSDSDEGEEDSQEELEEEVGSEESEGSPERDVQESEDVWDDEALQEESNDMKPIWDQQVDYDDDDDEERDALEDEIEGEREDEDEGEDTGVYEQNSDEIVELESEPHLHIAHQANFEDPSTTHDDTLNEDDEDEEEDYLEDDEEPFENSELDHHTAPATSARYPASPTKDVPAHEVEEDEIYELDEEQDELSDNETPRDSAVPFNTLQTEDDDQVEAGEEEVYDLDHDEEEPFNHAHLDASVAPPADSVHLHSLPVAEDATPIDVDDEQPSDEDTGQSVLS